jgi:hypothetical protein
MDSQVAGSWTITKKWVPHPNNVKYA